VFVALNTTLRRQRRRLATVAVVFGLAGVVAVGHSAMHDGFMGDAVVMCLAVAETAIVGVGAALAIGAHIDRVRCETTELPPPPLGGSAAPTGILARAGPPALQIFRL